MKIAIIHNPEITDREKYIFPLIRLFRDVSIVDAVIPKRGHSLLEKSIVGSTASHLKAISKYLINEPLLVLEDDAIIDSEIYSNIVSLNSVPEDCGAIILGGDGLPEPIGTWTPIVKKFSSAKAVIYLPRIKKTNFTETVWEILALSAIEQNSSLCHESIIMQSMQFNGIKLYRPPLLAVINTDTVSINTNKEFHDIKARVDDIPTNNR